LRKKDLQLKKKKNTQPKKNAGERIHLSSRKLRWGRRKREFLYLEEGEGASEGEKTKTQEEKKGKVSIRPSG